MRTNSLGGAPESDPNNEDSTAAEAVVPDGFVVTAATFQDWYRVVEWGNAEGWNIAGGDAACFHATDPEGFFIGRIHGQPVSAISVVNYSSEFAFTGHYLVDPGHRGQGLGYATARATSTHAGDRTNGAEANPDMVGAYRQSGYTSVHDTIHYGGALSRSGTVARGVVPVTTEHLDALVAYDRECFPAERRGFLSCWLAARGHVAFARLDEGRIVGYGVIRPAPIGHRIGPLFADTPEGAEALFDTLTANLASGDEVYLGVPGPQRAGTELVTARGLTKQFHTVRMYKGPVPTTREDRVFAIGTIELG